jgi:tRNA A22 N-methylase
LNLNLSPRLSKIYEYIQEGNELWDIGTDHGLIGLKSLIDKKVKKVHFVDKSSNVINSLYLKYQEQFLNKLAHDHYAGFYPVNGNELFQYFSHISGSIVLAGFGGLNMIKVVEALPQVLPGSNLILAPHRDEKNVLYHLLNKSYILKNKAIIIERKRERVIYNFIISK